MNVMVTGGTGFIGSALVSRLIQRGHTVTVIDRSPRTSTQLAGVNYVTADLLADRLKPEWFDGMDALIHLAGRNIIGVWTPQYKKSLYDSRVVSAQHLIEAMSHLAPDRQPKVIVSANAVGYYGNSGDEKLTEASPAGKDFLARLCRDWERVWQPLTDNGQRVVTIRTGIVLDKSGGMLQRLLPIYKIGAGAVLGNGQQWFSWISLQDLVEVYCLALEDESLQGPVNAVAPQAIQNRELTHELAESLNRKTFLHLPKWFIRLAGRDMANVLLASQRVAPSVLETHHFQFEAPTIRQAIELN